MNSHIKTLGVFVGILIFILLSVLTHGWFALATIVSLALWMVYYWFYLMFEASRKEKERKARYNQYNPVKERKWLS